jgi:hypothetical protein
VFSERSVRWHVERGPASVSPDRLPPDRHDVIVRAEEQAAARDRGRGHEMAVELVARENLR